MSSKTDSNLNNEILKKYDAESDKMEYTGIAAKIVTALAITFSIFQLYTAMFGVLDAQLQRAVHLSFGLCLAYLLYPSKKSWSRNKVHLLDVVLAVLSAAAPLYIVVNYKQLVLRAGTVTSTDLLVGLIGTILIIEATRRVVGIPMVTVILLFLVYAFAGPNLPGILAHRGLTVEQLISHIYYTTEGIFGIPLGVSSTFIFLFILFGAYLESTGLGKFFIDLANSIAGWASGGPAKVAVLSSGLMGTVSGSSVANVVGTGSLTIPMMKKLGYDKDFAGAVEAASSTGGQLMPPVMGAAAFLMAEFVGVPYIEIVKAAAIPALLYFAGVWLGVHFEAKRNNLKGVPRNELPKISIILKERGHLAIPLVVIVFLLVSGYTPMRAALAAIFLSIICSA
ncbi:MAG: TRAP transporter fused permease subunit, partial [Selenomonadaceae bacterium]|nr:TRAP transporter fused permease subunit [Selenomonadaceae bacterium]